ncbi:MAG: TIGR04438 family Trp-rich protein [Ideonella sp. MAG2]|nr:MAG: TIGR04438 family Trp-rich protein [Ideonella sp. MAG2]
MLFVVAGIAFIAMHFLGVGAPARWNWEPFGDLWKFISPFVLALAWWAWKDASGLSGQAEMKRDAERKAERQRRTIESLGLGNRRADVQPKDQ